ncbi:MAG: hypothetical protein IPI35_15275 [Deltaproteobacteria bacterium]|nr:hypothetical protein [Deltaproteobacteria bacterium]
MKNAFRRLQLFERLGVEQDSIRLIINKYDKKTAHLSIKDIEEKLNLKVAAVVDLDDKTLNQAVNEGRLVRDVNKRSPAVAAYSNMVTLITEREPSWSRKSRRSRAPCPGCSTESDLFDPEVKTWVLLA